MTGGVRNKDFGIKEQGLKTMNRYKMGKRLCFLIPNPCSLRVRFYSKSCKQLKQCQALVL